MVEPAVRGYLSRPLLSVLKSWLDKYAYEKGIKVLKDELDAPDIRRDAFRGAWICAPLTRPEANDDAVAY